MSSTGTGRLISNYIPSGASGSLPYPLTFGSISVSGRVDQPPTGTIVYKSLTRSQLINALFSWDVDLKDVNLQINVENPAKVTLHGTTLALESVSYQRSKYNIQGQYTELYDLTLNLGFSDYITTESNPTILSDLESTASRTGYLVYDKDKIEILPIGKGSQWTFSDLNVDTASKNRLLVTHLDTEIRLSRSPATRDNYLIEPKYYVYYEGDPYPDRPPYNSIRINDLSNLHDEGGIVKTSRKVEKLDGVTVKETIEHWGFLYYIADSPNVIGHADNEVDAANSLFLDCWVGIPDLTPNNPNDAPSAGQDDSDPGSALYKSGGIVERSSVPTYRGGAAIDNSGSIIAGPYYWTIADSQVANRYPGQPRIWVTVGYTEIEYTYSEPTEVEIEVEIIVPNVSKKGAFIVDPKYKSFINDYQPGNSTIRLKSRAKYLTSVVETGWKMQRCISEDIGDPDKDVANPESSYRDPLLYPKFNPLIYQKLPYYKKTEYKLASTRRAYDNAPGTETPKVSPPFSISFQSYTELDVGLKKEFEAAFGDDNPTDYLTPDYKVAIVTPNPNYVEPLYPEVERSHENSALFTLDTQKIRDSPYDAWTYHSTGTEIITNTVITPIVGSQQIINGVAQYNNSGKPSLWYGYSKFTSNMTAEGGADANAKLQSASSTDSDGLPPEQPSYLQQYLTSSQDPDGFENQTNRTRYYLTTNDNTTTARTGVTWAVDAATIEEADKLIDLALRKDVAEKIQANVTLRWHYPSIMPGDSVVIDSELGSDWIVYARSWEETYNGVNNATGRLFITTSGTQLTLGLNKGRKYTIESSTNKFTDEVEPFVKINVDLDLTTDPLPKDLLGRRNYGTG